MELVFRKRLLDEDATNPDMRLTAKEKGDVDAIQCKETKDNMETNDSKDEAAMVRSMETSDSKDEAAMVRSIANQSCAGCEKPLTEENLQAVAWLKQQGKAILHAEAKAGEEEMTEEEEEADDEDEFMPDPPLLNTLGSMHMFFD